MNTTSEWTDDAYQRVLNSIDKSNRVSGTSQERALYAELGNVKTALLTHTGGNTPVIDHGTADAKDILNSPFVALGTQFFQKYGEFSTQIAPLSSTFSKASNADPLQSSNAEPLPKPSDLIGGPSCE